MFLHSLPPLPLFFLSFAIFLPRVPPHGEIKFTSRDVIQEALPYSISPLAPSPTCSPVKKGDANDTAGTPMVARLHPHNLMPLVNVLVRVRNNIDPP